MQYTNLQNNFSKICLSLLTPTKFNQIHSNKKDSPDESIDKNIQWITSDPFNSTIEGSLWLLQVKVGRLYYFFFFFWKTREIGEHFPLVWSLLHASHENNNELARTWTLRDIRSSYGLNLKPAKVLLGVANKKLSCFFYNILICYMYIMWKVK